MKREDVIRAKDIAEELDRLDKRLLFLKMPRGPLVIRMEFGDRGETIKEPKVVDYIVKYQITGLRREMTDLEKELEKL